MNNDNFKSGEGVANHTPVGGVGNAPLKHSIKAKNSKTLVDGADSTTTDIAKFFHASSTKNIDVSRRLLSKQFSFFDDEAKTTCPIGGVSVNIDYLQSTGLIPIDSETEPNLKHKLTLLLSLLTQHFGTLVDQKKSMTNGKWKYQNHYKSNHGVIFCYNFCKEGLRYYIQISGIPIRMMRIQDWKSLITRICKKYYGNLTRIDICTDDYKQRVTGRKLLSVIERGDVARAFNYKYVGSGIAGVGDEICVYLGSNRKQLYHYNAEHLHGLPAYRFESRLREDKARIIGKSIADFDDLEENQNLTDDELMEALLRWLGSVCLGCVEFLHRNGHRGKSLGKYKKYDFWQSLTDDVGATTHKEIENIDSNTISLSTVNDIVNKRIDELEKKLISTVNDTVNERINELEIIPSSQTVNDTVNNEELKNKFTTNDDVNTNENTTNMTVSDTVNNGAELSLSEAFQLAQSRGYKGKAKTFSRTFTKHKDNPSFSLHGIKRCQKEGNQKVKYTDVYSVE